MISQTKIDWICIPGERVGPITSKTSEEEVIRIFGKSNVSRSEEVIGEGMGYEKVTIVFKGKSNEFKIKWKENRLFKNPSRIEIYGYKTKWKLPDGITIGTSLEELIKINKKDFLFYGFNWDYSGFVASWNGGIFDKKYKKNTFTVRLCPGINDPNLLNGFSGDRQLTTNLKGIEKLKICVTEIAINFK
jgi:hypothetical protein